MDMKEKHTMVRVVQIASGLFVLLGCLTLFIYSPFYSKMIVYLLNTFVAVDVNEVAAKSQRMGSLSDSETLEPGSNLWIARQAYLKVLEEEIKHNNSKHITYIQMRYKELTDLIKEENLKAKEEQRPEVIKVPLSSTEPAASEVVQDSTQVVKELLELNRSENKALMDKYKDFLLVHADDQLDSTSEVVSNEDIQEISEIENKTDSAQAIEKSKPYAIVVLGGGLTLDKNGKDIIVNNYTKLRLEKTLEIEKKYHLPIVLSGVEAPYMQKWLKNYNVDANLLEDRSMNTCENSRFSSLLLQKKGGAPTVILITDQYHMPRTRRLFALNGIETIPVEAPIPTQLTTWRPSLKNYDHSRRANYEALATIRDVFFGLSDCREIP
jgi:uncharacterized SAM-binding protein YcdF (DUF218 family)